MKRLTLLLLPLIILLLVSPGCETCLYKSDMAIDNFLQDPTGKARRQDRINQANRIERARLAREEVVRQVDSSINTQQILYRRATDRGYIKVAELEILIKKEQNIRYYKSYSRDNALHSVVIEDLLPFKAIFYLALEEENYDKAELTRRSWIRWLKTIKGTLDESLDRGSGRIEAKEKVEYQIEKLTSVVGLTNSMLLSLRKELALAMAERKWADAQKIQNLIASKVNELRPQSKPQPQPVQTLRRGGTTVNRTTVVVQQPSTQRVEVQQVPRYGATDVGRAISLLNGKGGRLSNKTAGTLKLFDILMGR